MNTHEKSFNTALSRGVNTSSHILKSDAVSGSSTIINSSSVVGSHSVVDSVAITNSKAIVSSRAISNSFGVSNSICIHNSFFVHNRKNASNLLFNTRVTEKRINEVRDEFNKLSHNWHPTYSDTVVKTIIQKGTASVSEIKEAWYNMPLFASSFLCSLPEFNRDIFQKVISSGVYIKTKEGATRAHGEIIKKEIVKTRADLEHTKKVLLNVCSELIDTANERIESATRKKYAGELSLFNGPWAD